MDIERAFVLHAMDYKDSSKILYLYTEKGHLSVLAHGVKKLNSINRYLSQNGTEIKCTISKGSFPSLRDGELLNEYTNIKTDLVAYTYMNHILELVRHTISDDLNHHKMYEFMCKIFDRIDSGIDPEILSFIFELKLLFFIGNGLHLHECSVCGNKDNLVFHISSGGLTCKEHLERITDFYEQDIYDIIKVLYYLDITKTDIPHLDENTRVIIRHIIDLLFSEFVGFETKSRSILKQLKKY